MSEQPKCELCGEPMPAGEEMFKYHGYSGPCPKPPLVKDTSANDLLAECEKTASQCLAPFRADRQAVINATTLIYNLVIAQLTEPAK